MRPRSRVRLIVPARQQSSVFRRVLWATAVPALSSFWGGAEPSGSAPSLDLLSTPHNLVSSLEGQNELEQFRRAEADIVRYHAMLDAYLKGNASGGVDALASWPMDRLRRALTRAQTADDPFRPWDEGRYGLAAMLHTDVALSKSGGLDAAATLAHLELAVGMLARGTREGHPRVRTLAPRWFQAISRYLRDREAPYLAARLLSDAREWLGTDALILYESGTLAESLATDYALAEHVTGRWARDAEAIQLPLLLERRTRHLNDAARWLRSAVRLDPANSASRLHLGRVEALRLEDETALRLLSPLTADPDSSTAYLAALFSAAVHERRSRLADAVAAYRLAITKLPFGHAAHVGLSSVLARMGDADGARQFIIRLITIPADRQAEPRWNYQWEPTSWVERRLDTLRAEVRR